MSNQQHETNAGYEERRRRRQQAATHARAQAQAEIQNPGRVQLSHILTTRRQEIGRTVVEMFRSGYHSVGIGIRGDRTLHLSRNSPGTQMNVIHFDGRELTLQFNALAELLDANGNTLASTGLEVTTRETLGEDGDDDDDESFVANSSTSGGDSSNPSSSSASEQGDEGDIGDSDAESDSDQELYREEFQGQRTYINLSYEGTLALLRELGGEDSGTTNPQNFEAQVLRELEDIAGRSVYQGGTQEDHPLPALYHDDHDDSDATPESAPAPRPEHVYTALRAMDGEWTHVVQHGNTSRLGQRRDFSLIDDEAFDAMIDIVHRYRVNPDEVDRDGVSDSAAQALREAGVEWTDLVEFLRRQQRRPAVAS